MPYISISNVRVEEVNIESEENGFCVVELLSDGGRIMIRKSRIFNDRRELEVKLGLSPPVRKPGMLGPHPAHYFH